ncbi:Hypothetical protein, putative [Bodo saltans]|uniref:Uncharacterized protein n=1 Tax=Bodo saltans TaxID=75058 RepID=A0A0S4IYR5_BODSA|nr:Hypothetical protein, putative [Bodo saltans]|eukprot:CUG02646.1 Hypothetical protein, putative [Bodo saltans]
MPQAHDDSLAALRERDGNWALVAASVMPWTTNYCSQDPLQIERRHLRDSLDAYLLPIGRYPKALAAGRTPGELSTQVGSTQQSPWTCKALAQQSGDKWVPPVASGNGTARLSAAVYYGLEGFADIAGHAMEVLFNAIGQYIADGLNETGVPWLVPCSDEWVGSVRPLVWVQFFLELNAGLGFPVYPVDYNKYLNSNRRELVLFFDTVYFASSYLSRNIWCFKSIVAHALWPLAEKRASSRMLTTHQGVAYMKRKSSAPSHTTPIRSLLGNSTASDRIHTPHRAFTLTSNFVSLMTQNNVTLMSNGPLLERMWHVNHAELIVSTWGSAVTIATLLLLPQSLLAALNVSRPPRRRRMLVYIQEMYCYEATRLLGMSKEALCRYPPRRHRRQAAAPLPPRPDAMRRTKVLRGGLLFSQGAMNDFELPPRPDAMRRTKVLRGGILQSHGAANDFVEDSTDAATDFCVMYVFLTSLTQVMSSDFDFRCDAT